MEFNIKNDKIILASMEATLEQQITLPMEYSEFKDVFEDQPIGTLPPHRTYDHSIPTEEGKEVPFGPLYKLAPAELEELQKYLEDNLKKGFIRRSTSPAGAPVLFVKKKDGSLRLCVDYRKLNDISIKNRCPLPLIDETLDQLQGAEIFTKLDAKGAYNLIRIAKGDEWKTAFRTRYGHYEYLVMPFGLTNAPATFQAYINDVLKKQLDHFVVVYLDDILIYSKNYKEHLQHVKVVLKQLREAKIQLKLSKCVFHAKEVEFLGFIVNKDGVKMDGNKVRSVLEWKSPRTVKEIQSFLGFANFYRRFIKGFSKIVAPITRLLKKEVKFDWNEEAEQAFQQLKIAFTSDPILTHFEEKRTCVIETDASDTALGAVCSQEHEGVLHPVAFYSRSLTPAERNYHVHDKELLAIVEALQHWRHYTVYSKEKTRIFTDHKNLLYFTNRQRWNARQMRWSHILNDYNYEIIYRPGASNRVADALSRQPQDKVNNREDEEISLLNKIIGLNATEDNDNWKELFPGWMDGTLETDEDEPGPSKQKTPTPEKKKYADWRKPMVFYKLDPNAPSAHDFDNFSPDTSDEEDEQGKTPEPQYIGKEKGKEIIKIDDTPSPIPEILGDSDSEEVDDTPPPPDNDERTANEIIRLVLQHTPQDEHMQEIIEDLRTDGTSRPGYEIRDNLLMFNGTIEVPEDSNLKRLIMTYCHDTPLAGHFGVFKTYDLVARTFHWPGMRNYIKKYVLSCDTCQRNKTARHKKYGLLKSLPVPDHPWTSISMDLMS
jgi:hypothetical protein